MTTLRTPMDVLEDTTGLDSALADRAAEYCREWDGWQYGMAPSSAAAAAYYAAGLLSDQPTTPTQQEVAGLFGVARLTIREHYKDVLGEATDTMKWT